MSSNDGTKSDGSPKDATVQPPSPDYSPPTIHEAGKFFIQPPPAPTTQDSPPPISSPEKLNNTTATPVIPADKIIIQPSTAPTTQDSPALITSPENVNNTPVTPVTLPITLPTPKDSTASITSPDPTSTRKKKNSSVPTRSSPRDHSNVNVPQRKVFVSYQRIPMKADKGKKRISQKPYNDATDKNGEEYRIVNGVKTLPDGQYRVFFAEPGDNNEAYPILLGSIPENYVSLDDLLANSNFVPEMIELIKNTPVGKIAKLFGCNINSMELSNDYSTVLQPFGNELPKEFFNPEMGCGVVSLLFCIPEHIRKNIKQDIFSNIYDNADGVFQDMYQKESICYAKIGKIMRAFNEPSFVEFRMKHIGVGKVHQKLIDVPLIYTDVEESISQKSNITAPVRVAPSIAFLLKLGRPGDCYFLRVVQCDGDDSHCIALLFDTDSGAIFVDSSHR